VSIQRTDGTDGVVSVLVETRDGSALAGQDYTALSTRVSFAAGETVQSILVRTVNDSNAEAAESFALVLSAAQGGATVSVPSEITINIDDNDAAPPPSGGGGGGGGGCVLNPQAKPDPILPLILLMALLGIRYQSGRHRRGRHGSI